MMSGVTFTLVASRAAMPQTRSALSKAGGGKPMARMFIARRSFGGRRIRPSPFAKPFIISEPMTVSRVCSRDGSSIGHFDESAQPWVDRGARKGVLVLIGVAVLI